MKFPAKTLDVFALCRVFILHILCKEPVRKTLETSPLESVGCHIFYPEKADVKLEHGFSSMYSVSNALYASERAPARALLFVQRSSARVRVSGVSLATAWRRRTLTRERRCKSCVAWKLKRERSVSSATSSTKYGGSRGWRTNAIGRAKWI